MKQNFTSKRSWLLGTAALALAVSGTAYGQDATGDDEDEAVQDVVIVTGIRGSIANSIAAKRNSDSIVEAISAEDIGKLPDNSIAESLARLPGLTAQRLRGRAQVISVRGLGPDFTTALLNGREQVTAGDNRGVEFDQYPSELLSSVLVYKTPDASLIGQGLAGTADLRTVRPLDYSERTVSVGARYEWADIGALNAGSDAEGYRFTGTYIDQFANDTIGVAIGIVNQSSPTQAERWEVWGYPTTGPNNALVLGGVKPYVESRDLERTSVLGTFEYEPSGTFSTSVDLYYSTFEDSGNLRGIEFPLQWSGAQLQPGFTEANGFVNSGIYNGVQGVVRNDFRGRDVDVFAAGWNAKYDLNDLWSVEGDLSFSKVERKDVDLETYSGTGAGFGNGVSDNLAFLQSGNGAFAFGPTLDYTDTSLFGITDPQGWGQVCFIKRPETDDELTALRLSAKRDFDNDVISSVEFGANYSQREKVKTSVENFIDLATPGATNFAPIPADLLIGNTSLDFIGIPGVLSYDPQALLSSGLLALRPNLNAGVLQKGWSVDEDILTLYVQANVNTSFNGLPLRGNIGVQWVDTDQSSTGVLTSGVPGESTPYTLGTSYSEWLPSANFSLEVAENTYVRFGAARTLARARMDQLAASGGLPGVNNTNAALAIANGGVDINNSQTIVLSSGGGNPLLRPYIADSIDLSFEHYFADGGGSVTVAAFRKDFDTFIDASSTAIIDYASILPTLNLTPAVAAIPNVNLGSISGPANFSGGHLQGLEFSASVPADIFFEGPLSGFGVIASVSFTESSVQPDDEASPIPIEGLSETVGNVTVYYEYAGFEARVSNRFRSNFLGEVTGFGAGRDLRSVKAESVVDAQIGYAFESGQLEGVSIQLQANNLTDEEFVTFLNGDELQIKDYQQYGTTYLLGVNYKF